MTRSATLPTLWMALLFTATCPVPARADSPASAAAHTPTARTDRYGDALPPGAVARIGTIRYRSDGPVEFAALTSDGQRVVVKTRSLSLLDATTGLPVITLPARYDDTYKTLSPDSKWVAVIDRAGNLVLRDLASGAITRTFTGVPLNIPTRPVFSAASKVLACAFCDSQDVGEALAWDVVSGKPLATLRLLHNLEPEVALSPDGKFMASWGRKALTDAEMQGDSARALLVLSAVQLWSLPSDRNSELRRIYVDDRTGVIAAAFAPDGKSLAVASKNGQVTLFNPATANLIREIGRVDRAEIDACADGHAMPRLVFAPDGKRLAFAARDVTIWKTGSGNRVRTKSGPGGEVKSIAFSGKDILVCSRVGQGVVVWDATTGARRGPWDAPFGTISSVALTGNVRTLCTVGSSGEFAAWDVSTGQQLRRVTAPAVGEAPLLAIHSLRNDRNSSVLSADARYGVCSSGSQCELSLRDLSTGREVRRFPLIGTTDGPCASFSRKNAWVALGGLKTERVFGSDRAAGHGVYAETMTNDPDSKHDSAVLLYRLEDGRLVHRLEQWQGVISAIALSPDARLVAVSALSQPSGDPNLTTKTTICDVATGEQLVELRDRDPACGACTALQFSVDGALLAVSDLHGVHLYDVATGKDTGVLPCAGPAWVLAFSPDNRVLAIGCWPWHVMDEPQVAETRVQLWELASGSLRQEFLGHRSEVTALAFSENGRWLASGSADATALLWDTDFSKSSSVAATSVTPANAEMLWRPLGSAKAGVGYEAVLRLSAERRAALALLGRKLQPAPSVPDKAVLKQFAQQLDSTKFAEREAAADKLRLAGRATIPGLRSLLQSSPSAELTERTRGLITQIEAADRPANNLQTARALEVLERLRTSEARALLTRLARGRPDAWQTREAKKVLTRITPPI